MIYNKTCLFSATAGTNSITLSEPLSAFERYVVKVNPGVYWESVCTGDRSVQRYNRYGSYNNDGYIEWPANWVISNGTKSMSCNRFQLLMQLGTNNKTQLFGWNNTAGNIKNIMEVWGINRKDYTTAQGEGKPEGEGWHAYDETLLWSGTDYANQSHIDLSGRALEYERLKIGVGSFGESTNIYDVDAPQSYSSWLPLRSYWGTTTGSFYLSMHRYRWDNETSGLSAVSGKTWQLGTGAADPFSTTGNYTATDSFIRRPVWAIWGVNHKKPYKFVAEPSEGGTVSSDRVNGYENDIATITVTPESDAWRQSALNITGATLTGDQFQFETSDVQVQGNFEHNKTLTLIDGEHAVLSADKDKGFIGDVVTVTGTMDEGWYLTGFNTTGATMTGNKFAFAGEDVTVEGLYTDEGFPVVYEAENGVHLTGDPIAIPGVGVNLTTSYDTYYRTNGYDITGGYIENGMLYATAACTARLKSKLNAFTATGEFEKGSNVECAAAGSNSNAVNIAEKYAIRNASTGEIPASWYSNSNRWHPSNASAYKITLNTKMYFTTTATTGTETTRNGCTVVSLVGSTENQKQTYAGKPGLTYSYNKSFTSESQDYYGVSARMTATGWKGGYGGTQSRTSKITYIATGTNGSWTATGYAP